jgi:hypothetical protein
MLPRARLGLARFFADQARIVNGIVFYKRTIRKTMYSMFLCGFYCIENSGL